MIEYQLEPDLSPDAFIALLKRTTLGPRRPVDNRETIAAMIANADIVLTARSGGQLIGISRAITDRAFCTYLSCLAVDEEFQRQGIGRELILRTHEEAGRHTTLLLLSAPQATAYYPHIGMSQHPSCWMIPPHGTLSPEKQVP